MALIALIIGYRGQSCARIALTEGFICISGSVTTTPAPHDVHRFCFSSTSSSRALIIQNRPELSAVLTGVITLANIVVLVRCRKKFLVGFRRANESRSLRGHSEFFK